MDHQRQRHDSESRARSRARLDGIRVVRLPGAAAAHGERSPERINHRNGYRERTWETRAGTVALKIPKLRKGSLLAPCFLCNASRMMSARAANVIDNIYFFVYGKRQV